MGRVTWGPPREILHGLKVLFSPNVFVETGTFLGETAAWAAGFFDSVYTIEAAKELYLQASKRHTRLNNVKFLNGESQAILAEVVAQIDQPALFWLDAHWSGGPTWGSDQECPLLEELAVICASSLDHLILIDDARLFLAPPPSPHKPEQWPDIGQICKILGLARRRVAIVEDVIIAVPEHRGVEFSAFQQNYLRRYPSELSLQAPAAWTFSPLDLASKFQQHNLHPRGVIHIGAHHGQELPLYLKMGFKRALLVEANPSVFANLEKKSRQLLHDLPKERRCQVKLANCAITNIDGEAELRINANSESSSLLALKDHLKLFPQMIEVERVRVPCRTLDSLVAAVDPTYKGFNFLNVDVQGAELLVLSNGLRTLANIDAVCSEINFSELYEGCALAWQLDEFLKQHGFERVSTHHPHRLEWGDALYLKAIKVSAIVSTYDSADLFLGRMENLIDQTLFASGQMEIIVIDSASPGNEQELVRPFMARYPGRIRYIRTPVRETIYAAWNRAIEIARGEYITNQNVDDRMKRDGIERLARYLDDHPECVLAHGDQEQVNRGMHIAVENLSKKHWNWGTFSRIGLLFDTQVGSQPMWRTRAHYFAGYFDPKFAALGDREFYLRLSQYGEFHYIPEVLGSLDYMVTSLSRTKALSQPEAQLIFNRYLANDRLASLLGYSSPDEEDEVSRQILRNNLCCELVSIFCTSRTARKKLATIGEILSSVASTKKYANTVQSNLEIVNACLLSDKSVNLTSLRLAMIDLTKVKSLTPVLPSTSDAAQSLVTPFKLERRNFSKHYSPLLKHKRNIASQSGEDGIIEHIFSLIPELGGHFVEFGAWDGRHLSNCWNLAVNHGWAGCFIEAEESRFKALLQNHGSNDRIACVNKFVSLEGAESLDAILASAGVPLEFSILSIDIDGMDYFVWESLRSHSPYVVVIEFNPTIPNDVLFVQPKDFSVNQGSSLLALVELAQTKGYELICCTPFNAFFVRSELFSLFNIADNSIQTLYKPILDGRIFQGYDSKIYVSGMPKLLWGNKDLSNDDFQVLGSSDQVFSDRRQNL